MLRPPAWGGGLLGSVLCTAKALPGAGALLALAAALALLALFRVGLLRICLLQPLQNLQWFRGGLVFKAHRSLTSGLDSNTEEAALAVLAPFRCGLLRICLLQPEQNLHIYSTFRGYVIHFEAEYKTFRGYVIHLEDVHHHVDAM